MTRGIASGKGGPAWGNRLDLRQTLSEQGEPEPVKGPRLWTREELSRVHQELDELLARARAIPYRVAT